MKELTESHIISPERAAEILGTTTQTIVSKAKYHN